MHSADCSRVSTISQQSRAGGYIGGWVTAWGSRNGWNMAGVQERLASRSSPKQVENLREFTNYLTPRAGLMSADTWVGVATIARNLALNWSLFLPLFLLTVAVPKFVAALFEGLAQRPELQPGAPDYVNSVKWMLIGAGILYGFAELFISKEILETQSEKNTEDVGREAAKTAAETNPDEDRKPPRPDPQAKVTSTNDFYGQGNVVSALVIVVFVAAAACVATGVLTRMQLQLTTENFLFFGVAGAAVWLAAFLVACVAIMRLRRSPSRAIPVSAIMETTRQDLIKLTAARTIGGVAFGAMLLLGFHLLGGLVQTTNDDRYAVVIGLLIFIAAHLAGGTVFSALSSRISRMDDALEWSARGAGWLFAAGFAWALYATLVLLDPEDVFAYALGFGNKLLLAVGGLSGLGAALFGYSRKTSVAQGQEAGQKKGLNWSTIAVLAAIVFFIVLIWECSYLFDQTVFGESFAGLIEQRRISGAHFITFFWAFAVLAIWSFVASYFVNVNKFSLHGFYRNRLIRSYLGATNLKRRPNAFTGFDQADNIEMGRLHGEKPLLIVNTALNLVHGDNLAWQERKASSFTISRIASGNPALGYRLSSKYGQAISLGTAIAISGAAVSPNMGYHSSPVLTFVMTLFNARLGWWLGNPRREAWDLGGPRQAFWAFLMELLGFTDDTQRFVYLSDGGHFENLGVYEMLRRRCRTIVAIDAGCDPGMKFEDLGNLVRKARIDFGVEVNFSKPTPSPIAVNPARLGLANRPDACGAAYCAVGEISYPYIEEKGVLIYVKAAIHGDEPEDVRSYSAAHPEFPHEPTGDQFFTESQFESYRRLGLHIGGRVLGGDGNSKSHALDLEGRAKSSVKKA